MKKKILFIATIVGMIILVGCQRFDFEEARQDAIRQNAEKIWMMVFVVILRTIIKWVLM